MKKIRFNFMIDEAEVLVTAIVYDEGEVDDVLITNEEGEEMDITEEIEERLMELADGGTEETVEYECYGSLFE